MPTKKMPRKIEYRTAHKSDDKPLLCLDCGAPIPVTKRGRPSVRCASCQRERNLARTRAWKKEHKKK